MTVKPEITVTKDGPYEVTGDIGITLKRVITSEHGESLAWQTGSDLPHDSPTWLCRCGQSGNKPFCDGSHRTSGFDGTETASTTPFFEHSKAHAGQGLVIHRVGSLCAKARFCVNRATDWYQMLPSTADTNVRTQVIAMVEHCPSGTLVCEIDGEVVEPDLPPAVCPVEDGPLWVTGRVSIVRSDGIRLEARNRVTLCRCGKSENKPFCDGTHLAIGFEAKHPDSKELVEAPARTVPSPLWAYERLVVGVHRETTAETYQVAGMGASAALSEGEGGGMKPAKALAALVHAATEQAATDEVLAEASERAESAGIPADRLTATPRTDHPANALNEVARQVDSGLMIVGRGGDRLARLPRRVSYRSPCDVLVVARRGRDRPDSYRRIVIATDGSKTADRAARRGYDFARALQAPVDLVFVGHPATGELVISDTLSVFGRGVDTEVHLIQGSAADKILEVAEAVEADIIVVGNKGMTGAAMISGTSVPGAVLKGARCDVLLCRTVHQRESELEPGDGGVTEREGEPVAAYMDQSGQLHLMSARCPHLGCTVGWNPVDKTFDCPCHGSRFGPLGQLLEGPATKPLRSL